MLKCDIYLEIFFSDFRPMCIGLRHIAWDEPASSPVHPEPYEKQASMQFKKLIGL